MNKIYLGKIGQAPIYITKHSWECSWYWSFGYLGNRDMHFPMESLINYSLIEDSFLSIPANSQNFTDIGTIFSETWLTQSQWWVIRDLFIQAYALKNAAGAYRHGGYQTTLKGITDIIISKDMENKVNSDLKKVLDITWDYLVQIREASN